MNSEEGIFDNRDRALSKTQSPSIDILLPSNLERYLCLLSDEEEKSNEYVQSLMKEYKKNKCFQINKNMKKRMDEELCCGKSSDSASEQMMKKVFNLYNVKIDPHTAVGIDVAYSFSKHIFEDDQDDEDKSVPMV